LDSQLQLLWQVLLEDMAYEIRPALNEDTPAVVIGYGKFLKYLIDFLIISFVLFLIVKQYNKAVPPPPPGPTQEELLAEIRDALNKYLECDNCF